MKRDMDLVRAILLAIEASKTSQAPHPLVINGHHEHEIYYHALIMSKAGLIDAADVSTRDHYGAAARRLTWAGHEFLDAARDDTFWRKTMATVRTAAGGVTIGVLKDLLVLEVKSRLHLTPGGARTCERLIPEVASAHPPSLNAAGGPIRLATAD